MAAAFAFGTAVHCSRPFHERMRSGHGLGTCIESQGVSYPEVIRRFANIPESKRITISIAIGYPDLGFPANKLESKREPIESIVTWHGFEKEIQDGF